MPVNKLFHSTKDVNRVINSSADAENNVILIHGVFDSVKINFAFG